MKGRSNPVETFLEEAEELLAEVEQAALLLAGSESPEETINQLFRSFHTLKGSGAMCGLNRVAGFTHHVETLLDKVREGDVALSDGLTDLVLAAKDHVRLLLAAETGGEPVEEQASEPLIARLMEACGGTGPAAEGATGGAAVASSGAERTWKIRFRPDPNLLMCGGNPLALFSDLHKLGACEITAHTEAIPALELMQADRCYLSWTITLRTSADRNTIWDVFIFVEEGSELAVELVDESAQAVVEVPVSAAPEAGLGASKAVSAVHAPEAAHKAQTKEATVRVPSARLDRLVNLVGELVMNQSRVAQTARKVGAPELAEPISELERLVAELRDDVLEIRMLPIGTIFGRFRRLVHDLSVELGKEVELITEGGETELDKSILDQLGEPLVHMLRNSIDHGIEPAEERVANGKPRRGTIRLVAAHTGSDVAVSIEDDGHGIDCAVIRAKAVEKQLIAADANLSQKETLNLILLPGFSTASQVTSVSGRGVGMDVVKRQIDMLRGSLSIASEKGRGSRMTLTLPLTLAIIEGLLVQIGVDQFIIPMAAITENVELERAERLRNNGRNVIAVRGELIPYIGLREAFRIEGGAPNVEKIVIVKHEDQRVGLVVDRVLGTHQTVIQSLGKFFRKIEVVSGATIMGDGRVALILDIAAAIRFADRQLRPERHLPGNESAGLAEWTQGSGLVH